jgi:hypothetical protein
MNDTSGGLRFVPRGGQVEVEQVVDTRSNSLDLTICRKSLDSQRPYPSSLQPHLDHPSMIPPIKADAVGRSQSANAILGKSVSNELVDDKLTSVSICALRPCAGE